MNHSSKVRPSPSQSATLFSVGTIKKGNDGNMWVIKANKNGVNRWILLKDKLHLTTQQKKSTKHNVIISTKKDKQTGFEYEYVKKYKFNTFEEHDNYIKNWRKKAKKYYIKMSQIPKISDKTLVIIDVTEEPILPRITYMYNIRKDAFPYDGYAGWGTGAHQAILASDLSKIGPWPYYDSKFRPSSTSNKSIQSYTYTYDIVNSGRLIDVYKYYDRIKKLIKNKQMKKLSNKNKVYKQIKKKIILKNRRQVAFMKYITIIIDKLPIMIISSKAFNTRSVHYHIYGTSKAVQELMSLMKKI